MTDLEGHNLKTNDHAEYSLWLHNSTANNSIEKCPKCIVKAAVFYNCGLKNKGQSLNTCCIPCTGILLPQL
jgi:hypothetical protein